MLYVISFTGYQFLHMIDFIIREVLQFISFKYFIRVFSNINKASGKKIMGKICFVDSFKKRCRGVKNFKIFIFF